LQPTAAMAEAATADAGAVNSDVKVKKAALEKAIRAILQVVAKRSANANPLFAEAAETMYLQFGLAKIPERMGKTTMITLPHPLYGEKAEACFISKTPQKKYKEMLLQKHTVPGLTKVIGVEKLKKKYKNLAEKRTLADAFDLFLCDKTVIEMMPQVLGSVFYKQKLKAPVPVQLRENGEDPSREIRKAMAGTKFRLGSGRCIGVRFGRCSMTEEQLHANASAVIAASLKLLGRNGILLQAITVQATNTIALPVWRRPAPPGDPVNLKKWREQQASSAASDTGASGVSDSEITGSEIISDAGETLSTRDSMSEVETAGETMSEVDTANETLSEMDSEADEAISKEDLPLVQGLKKKKRKRQAPEAPAAEVEVEAPEAKAPKKAAKKKKKTS